MSYNIYQDSSLVGIGYVRTTFSGAYPVPNASLDLLFSQAGRSIDITARLLGDLDSFNYMAEVSGTTDTLAKWIGDTEVYSNISYVADRSGFPLSVPSGISDGLNLLEANIGDMNFPSVSSGYWNTGGNAYSLPTTMRSISSEISFIERLNLNTYMASGERTPKYMLYDPIAGLEQGNFIAPIVPDNLGGRPPTNGVIGIFDYTEYAMSSGWLIPTNPDSGSVTSPGNIPVIATATASPLASGLWPLTIDDRLEKLNTYENFLKDVLIQKLTWYNQYNPRTLTGSSTKTFTVPDGVPIGALTFELWGAGGGGGGGLAMYKSSNWAINNTLRIGGGGGCPGSYLRISFTGFKAGDRFVLTTGAGGTRASGRIVDWSISPASWYDGGFGGQGGDSYIRYMKKNGSSYIDCGIIARAWGGYGGRRGEGRLDQPEGNAYTNADMPSIADPTYAALGGLVISGTPTIVKDTANGANGLYVFLSGITPYTRVWTPTTPAYVRAYMTGDCDHWRQGGPAKSVNGYGTGGSGSHAFSSPTVQSAQIDNGTNGDSGRIVVSWNDYTYAPNPGGLDTRWLLWRQDW